MVFRTEEATEPTQSRIGCQPVSARLGPHACSGKHFLTRPEGVARADNDRLEAYATLPSLSGLGRLDSKNRDSMPTGTHRNHFPIRPPFASIGVHSRFLQSPKISRGEGSTYEATLNRASRSIVTNRIRFFIRSPFASISVHSRFLNLQRFRAPSGYLRQQL
jgi:hypothetical protein